MKAFSLYTTLCWLLTLPLSVVCFAQDYELSGEAGIEQRYFFEDPLLPEQERAQGSVYLQPEFFFNWNDGDDRLVIKPFTRLDQHDSERSHFDLRELHWLHQDRDWEFLAGISKVFWGQTESLHLVDIINQTDYVEAVDGEDKLGQPMLSYSYFSNYGRLSAFILPYFRERTFASTEGRVTPPFRIDTDNPLFASSNEETNIDYALRWQHSMGNWDLGFSYFDGTNREPYLAQGFDPVTNRLVLQPYYSQIQQVGVDALAVVDAWLFKFEGIYRKDDEENVPVTLQDVIVDNFFAAVVGLEYTSVGVFDSQYDIGWLVEYQFDEREQTAFVFGQNDLMVGLRFIVNDIDGTEVLVGVVQDLDDSGSYTGFLEASSRITDQWRWKLDGYFFASEQLTDPLYFLRREDFVQFSLEYYF
ncbi:hypothetical protein QTP81_03170 [Alteromonas sp. ASW11-36]|uniref:Alginate export domain-containing protein n=1 Tax=Alteromonas arenosi TaxID=3055817 RepID=A0ABT7SVN4_9ALTE|nr:hypothetical protein [Alteromonas sp. ASW11-36]MDM7859607.1 hypothetical protein [Alteromonas sp. ASW11-36]